MLWLCPLITTLPAHYMLLITGVGASTATGPRIEGTGEVFLKQRPPEQPLVLCPVQTLVLHPKISCTRELKSQIMLLIINYLLFT